MRPTLILTDTPEARDKEVASHALYRHNVERTGVADRHPVAAVATDPGTGEVIGGLWGRTELGLLFLDMLYLPESLRGEGAGGQLLTLVEEEARRRGCRHAVVETSTFQAPGFYERHGYEEGSVKNLGRYAASWIAGWPKRPSSTAALT